VLIVEDSGFWSTNDYFVNYTYIKVGCS